MSNIWFTSDTHFGHANIIIHCKRPWLRDGDTMVNDDGREVWRSPEIGESRAEEMTEALIASHNAVVKPGDRVYHLGDFCIVKGKKSLQTEQVEKLVKRLNGDIHWIFGNHDHSYCRRAEGFASKQAALFLNKKMPVPFYLHHYACRLWPSRHYDAIHLYGHSHGTLAEDPSALSMDIGVDVWDYKPVLMEEVIGYMHEKKQHIIEAGLKWRGDDHHANLRLSAHVDF